MMLNTQLKSLNLDMKKKEDETRNKEVAIKKLE